MTFQQPQPPQAVEQPVTARFGPFPTLEHLWVLIALTLFGVYLSLVPTPPHDFWWHIRAGQVVAEQGIPTTNMFTWGVPAETPYTYAMWLSEWLWFQLYQIGGPVLLVYVRNLLGLVTFGLVALEAQRRSGSWRLAALAVLLAGAMSMNNLIVRPQNWAWPIFAIYMVMLGRYTAGQLAPRLLWVLPILMALWVNLHGTFVLGLVMLALVALGETIRWWMRQPEALDGRRVAQIYLIGVVAGLTALLNPKGIGIIGYVGVLTTNTVNMDMITDWLPPTTRSLAGRAFFAAIVLMLMVFGLSRRRPTITDVLLVGAFLWQAVQGQRYVVWFGLLAMPILVQCLSPYISTITRPIKNSMRLANALVVVVLLGFLIAVQPAFKWRLPLPDTYQEMFVDYPGAPSIFSADTPLAAVEYLRAHPGGPLFNEMGYGSYITWALYPTTKAFIDTRVELYDAEIWKDYLEISNGRNYHSLLVDKYGATRILLDRQDQLRLAQALESDERWVREFSDGRAEIYTLR